jgi:hypothetical protein
MFYWIYDIPLAQFAVLMAGVFVLFSWLGCFLLRPILRRFVPARSETNAIVGHVLSCHGVFYGLLLGLLALAAYQNRVIRCTTFLCLIWKTNGGVRWLIQWTFWVSYCRTD